MTRDEMIEYLSDSDFDYIFQTDSGLELLRSYLEDGFKGYSNFTDEELVVEIQQRREMDQLA